MSHSRFDKKVKYFAIPLLIIGFAALMYLKGTEKETEREYILQEDFSSIIISKYYKSDKYNGIYRVNAFYHRELLNPYITPKIFENIEPGDSIFKKSGELDYVIKKYRSDSLYTIKIKL